jgi:hypothetical protein
MGDIGEIAVNGVLIIGDKDKTIEGRARNAGLKFNYGDTPAIPYAKTLIVESGTAVPWDLLPAAWHFLDRWDAAVPFWRYGQTAAQLGDEADRRHTKDVIRDLRVLTHSVELLFVRDNEAGQSLITAYANELATGGDKRLAFLRALYTTKPRLCVLPTSWLNLTEYHNKQDIYSSRRMPTRNTAPLVKVEVEPGRFVRVHQGDEDRVIAAYQETKTHGRAKF